MVLSGLVQLNLTASQSQYMEFTQKSMCILIITAFWEASATALK